MELDDEAVLVFGEITALEIWPEVVDPAKAAALAATQQAGGLGEGPPAAFAVVAYVGDEALVFFFGPCAFVGVGLFTARRPSHCYLALIFFSVTSLHCQSPKCEERGEDL